MNINVRRAGSNTFKRADLAKGFEPDSAFYFGAHAEAVRGKRRLDLSVDPPPDLVIEIDVTNDSLPRFPIFAATGVPEVRRYDGEHVRLIQAERPGLYRGRAQRGAPAADWRAHHALLKQNQEMESTEWMLTVRAWARGRRDG